MARIGLFGGTFDPIHWGHLMLAEAAREAVALDRVEFIPAAHPPHKGLAPLTGAEERLAMVRLAVAGNPAFRVSDCELNRPGPSYSVGTAAAYDERLAEGDRLFFLIGSDTLAELPSWHEVRRLAELVTLVAVTRPGFDVDDLTGLGEALTPDQLESLRRHTVRMPLVDLASTDIRARVAEGQSIRYMVPAAVWDYIEARGLYGHGGAGQAGCEAMP